MWPTWSSRWSGNDTIRVGEITGNQSRSLLPTQYIPLNICSESGNRDREAMASLIKIVSYDGGGGGGAFS